MGGRERVSRASRPCWGCGCGMSARSCGRCGKGRCRREGGRRGRDCELRIGGVDGMLSGRQIQAERDRWRLRSGGDVHRAKRQPSDQQNQASAHHDHHDQRHGQTARRHSGGDQRRGGCWRRRTVNEQPLLLQAAGKGVAAAGKGADHFAIFESAQGGS